MPLAAIALGSNLPGRAGSCKANLDGAIDALRPIGNVVAHSKWYETVPVGIADQPGFLNGAAVLQTDLSPRELLMALLQIELRFGRDRSHGISKGPRTLDLDLLLYESQILHEYGLVVPHPAMHERRFVLEPLAEIAPDLQHPVLRKSVAELLRGVS